MKRRLANAEQNALHSHTIMAQSATFGRYTDTATGEPVWGIGVVIEFDGEKLQAVFLTDRTGIMEYAIALLNDVTNEFTINNGGTS